MHLRIYLLMYCYLMILKCIKKCYSYIVFRNYNFWPLCSYVDIYIIICIKCMLLLLNNNQLSNFMTLELKPIISYNMMYIWLGNWEYLSKGILKGIKGIKRSIQIAHNIKCLWFRRESWSFVIPPAMKVSCLAFFSDYKCPY